MASEKALYWMTVGLLTVVMGNHFVSKFNGNCLANKAQAAVGRISGQATHLMAMAEVAMGRTTSTRFDRAQSVMAMAQVRMASVQEQLARQEAACARLDAGRARMHCAPGNANPGGSPACTNWRCPGLRRFPARTDLTLIFSNPFVLRAV